MLINQIFSSNKMLWYTVLILIACLFAIGMTITNAVKFAAIRNSDEMQQQTGISSSDATTFILLNIAALIVAIGIVIYIGYNEYSSPEIKESKKSSSKKNKKPPDVEERLINLITQNEDLSIYGDPVGDPAAPVGDPAAPVVDLSIYGDPVGDPAAPVGDPAAPVGDPAAPEDESEEDESEEDESEEDESEEDESEEDESE